MTFKLYHYWRSSSSWRVRWALAHKKMDCQYIAISLLDDQQTSPEHLKRNPKGAVPVLEVIENHQTHYMAESTAILEWLEEKYPSGLLPQDSFLRAKARQLMQIVNAGIQPLQNLQLLKHVQDKGWDRQEWGRHWIAQGLNAYQSLVLGSSEFSVGDDLSLADLFLVPQLYNARRFQLDMTPYSRLLEIEGRALQTESGQASHPDQFDPQKS